MREGKATEGPIEQREETYCGRFFAFSLRRRKLCQHRLNGLYHLRVGLLPCRDDAKIPAECAAETKVKRTPRIIQDHSASLFEERPRGVILKTHNPPRTIS
jgi:hypothetical protein